MASRPSFAAASLLFCGLLGALGPACSSESADAGITGVYDAELTLQAGNSAKVRYWFTSDGKWGRVQRQTVGSTSTDTCGSGTDTSYELRGDKVLLRNGANTDERTWSFLEGNSMLKLDPPDSFPNGTPANTFKRVSSAQTNRTCKTAFE